MHVNLRRLRRITRREHIKQARLQIAIEKGQSRKVGRLQKQVARLDNKREILDLKKQLGEARKERRRLRAI